MNIFASKHNICKIFISLRISFALLFADGFSQLFLALSLYQWLTQIVTTKLNNIHLALVLVILFV